MTIHGNNFLKQTKKVPLANFFSNLYCKKPQFKSLLVLFLPDLMQIVLP